MNCKKLSFMLSLCLILGLLSACGSISTLEDSVNNHNSTPEVIDDEIDPILTSVELDFSVDSADIELDEITSSNFQDNDAEFIITVDYDEANLRTIKLIVGLHDAFVPDSENFEIDSDDVNETSTSNFSFDLLAVDGILDYVGSDDYYLWLWLVDANDNSSETFETLFTVSE